MRELQQQHRENPQAARLINLPTRLLLLALLTLVPAVAGENIKLTNENFQRSIKTGYTFVKFFAPWCGHCQNMAEDWNYLAEHFEISSIPGDKLKIGEVDCTKEEDTCIDEGIMGYPSIILYKDGKKATDYKYNRDFNRMKKFLIQTIGGEEAEPNVYGIYDLNDNTWETFMKKRKDGKTVVKFFAPWCGHCKTLEPIYEELATYFELEESEDVVFASVDCTDMESLDLCSTEGIDAYPTIHLYTGGDLEDIYTGDRNVEELINFVWENVDASRMENSADSDLDMLSAFANFGSNADGDEDEEDEDEEEEGDEEEDEGEEEEDEEEEESENESEESEEEKDVNLLELDDQDPGNDATPEDILGPAYNILVEQIEKDSKEKLDKEKVAESIEESKDEIEDREDTGKAVESKEPETEDDSNEDANSGAKDEL